MASALSRKGSYSQFTWVIAKDEKIDGDKITLAAEDEGRSIHCDLVLAADRMTGEVNIIHGGQTAKPKLDVTRAK